MNNLSVRLPLLLFTTVTLAGCGSVHTPENLSTVTTRTDTHEASSAVKIGESAIDQEAEEALSEGCVAAWRKALKGDEPGAMKQLQDLDKRYPKAITVKFMMGQVEEHSGKKAQAIKYYQDAVEKSSFNSMYLYKLAESLRTTGNARGAVPH